MALASLPVKDHHHQGLTAIYQQSLPILAALGRFCALMEGYVGTVDKISTRQKCPFLYIESKKP